jgi:hypothetical protein
LRVPRPEHQESDILEQEEWKKNLHRQVNRIKKKYPSSDVEVWSMDEHRLGLKPVLRREGVDEFSDATTTINWRFQWLWLYGFVHPSTGETYWWILPFVNHQLFERVLKDFAQHFQLGPKKRVVQDLRRHSTYSVPVFGRSLLIELGAKSYSGWNQNRI